MVQHRAGRTRPDELEEGVDARRLGADLDGRAVVADVDDLAAKVARETLDRRKVHMLLPQRLGRRQGRRSVVRLGGAGVRGDGGVGGHLRGVRGGRALLDVVLDVPRVVELGGELVLEVLGAEDRDFAEQELAFDAQGVSVAASVSDVHCKTGKFSLELPTRA